MEPYFKVREDATPNQEPNIKIHDDFFAEPAITRLPSELKYKIIFEHFYGGSLQGEIRDAKNRMIEDIINIRPSDIVTTQEELHAHIIRTLKSFNNDVAKAMPFVLMEERLHRDIQNRR